MKWLGRFFIYILLVILLALFFAPKRQLFYAAEHAIEPYGVVLSGEYIDDRGFALALQSGTLYYEDLKIATLGDVTLTPLLVYNSVAIAPFSLSEAMQQFLPGTIEYVRAYQSVVSPAKVNLSAAGDFGSLNGVVDLYKKTVTLHLDPSSILLEQQPLWLSKLKKQPSGEYLYEDTY